MRNKFIKANFLTAVLIGAVFVPFAAHAQTSGVRRKKVKPVNVSAPAPTVAAPNGGYVDGNQIVLGEYPGQPTVVANSDPNAATDIAPPPEPIVDRDAQIKELQARIKSLETGSRNDKQKQLLLNLDIVTRAETRAESLRKQLFDIIEKENSIQARLEQIDIESRSETIDRSVALMGSMRPEELRDQRRKSLAAEKTNLESLLTQIQSNRLTIENSVQKADALVEKIRTRLDRDIDNALQDDDEQN